MLGGREGFPFPAPTDPDVPDSGIRLLKSSLGSLDGSWNGSPPTAVAGNAVLYENSGAARGQRNRSGLIDFSRCDLSRNGGGRHREVVASGKRSCGISRRRASHPRWPSKAYPATTRPS